MNITGIEAASIKKNRIYNIVYAIMVVFFILMLIWAAVGNRGQSPAALLSEGNIAFDEGWYLEGGSAAGVGRLSKIPSVVHY